MKYHSKTFALDEGVLVALATLKTEYGSVNKGLRAILIDGGVAPAEDIAPIVGNTFEARHARAATALESATPSQSPSTLAVKSNSLKSNHCIHCGREFERPEGTKVSTMCNFCGRDGHQPWDVCKKCVEDAELERRRASSTACDTSSIDLNPDWGA